MGSGDSDISVFNTVVRGYFSRWRPRATPPALKVILFDSEYRKTYS